MYERIVVGTDGSKRALDAVRAAGRLAGLSGGDSVHVVVASRPYTSLDMSQIRAELPEEFHDLIDPHMASAEPIAEAAGVLGPSVEIIKHVVDGDPADAILSVAEEIDADLVVVGARGLGAVQRFMRGSVSTKVAHHSLCDVLIVEHDH